MKFLSYLLSGISLGSIYAIIALGYTMVYGIAKMLNFAHGDIIMVGGYVAFTAMTALNLPASAAVLLSVLFCTALGVIIEAVAYKPLRGANSLAVLITAIGVSYLLQNLALLIFGANPKSFRSVVPIKSMSFANGQLVISGETVAAIAVCFIIMVALTSFINKTRAGQAMLAVAEDRGAATLMQSARRSQRLRACCSARRIRPSRRPPAPCPASRPLSRRYSAVSARFPAR